MHLEKNQPFFVREENAETREITYLFNVQNDPPVRVSERGFNFLRDNGFTLNAHLNNKDKPSAQPRMRKPGDQHPHVLPTVIYSAFNGDIPHGEGVRPADKDWRNCHEDNLTLRLKTDTKKYAEAVDDLMAKHFVERDAVKKEQALMKRFRNR
jgi:hypothetical protein